MFATYTYNTNSIMLTFFLSPFFSVGLRRHQNWTNTAHRPQFGFNATLGSE